MMNSQEAHYLKQHLRFSGKDNADRLVELWSRVALVVDSELPDLKYILEVTEAGFQEYEFLSRMMYYKKDPERVVAYLRCIQPVTERQSAVLTQACKGLQGKDWKRVYASAPEWLQDLVQSALYESRVVLNRFVGEESFVKEQLRKVFELFTQTAGQTDEQLELYRTLHGYQEPMMRFEDIGNFLTFLAVSEKEKSKDVMALIADLEPKVKILRKR